MNQENGSKQEEKARRLAIGTVVAVCAVVFVMALTGYFTFFTKTFIVPIICVIAIVTRRFVPFIKDWVVFLSLVVLFDSLRGYIYYIVVNFDTDVYLNYPIDFEQYFCNGKVLSVWLQDNLFVPGNVGILEKILTIAHGSHFLFFLTMGFLIWFTRKEHFNKFKLGMILVMYGGLLGYFLFPTIPPWLASGVYKVLPPVERALGHVYNTHLPMFKDAFDINPIAAMPSLHTAFPIFLTAVAIRHYRIRGLLFIPYSLIMMFSLLYFAEHYIVDELAGTIWALTVYFFVYHTGIPGRMYARLFGNASLFQGRLFNYLNSEIKRKIALAASILIIAEVTGQIVLSEPLPLVDPTREFIEEQMMGRSELAHYYLGVLFYTEKDYSEAQKNLVIALGEIKDEKYLVKCRRLAAYCAFRNGDYAGIIAVLADDKTLKYSKDDVILLSTAYFETKRYRQGFDVLGSLEALYPCDPEIISRKALAEYRFGFIGAKELLVEIEALEKRRDTASAKKYAGVLRAAIEAKRTLTPARTPPGGAAKGKGAGPEDGGVVRSEGDESP